MFEALLTNRTVSVLWEALPRILTAGLTMTIPLTLISFSLAMVIAVAVALVQYANVPVLRQIARFYIWVIRGTPLLVQLFIIFYGLPSLGIMLDALFFLRQKETKGLGHAVWRAKSFVGNEPFAVLLGDDIMLSEKPVLKQLVEAAEANSCSAVAVREVPDELITKYSSVKLIEQLSERVYKIGDMNEKPTLEEKFSNFAILGRYVLTPAIFDILEHTAPGRNNEIQLTDGMKELCLHEPMCAVDFEGRRYDTGNLKGYLEAIIDFALKNDEAGEWLRQFIIDKAELLK